MQKTETSKEKNKTESVEILVGREYTIRNYKDEEVKKYSRDNIDDIISLIINGALIKRTLFCYRINKTDKELIFDHHLESFPPSKSLLGEDFAILIAYKGYETYSLRNGAKTVIFDEQYSRDLSSLSPQIDRRGNYDVVPCYLIPENDLNIFKNALDTKLATILNEKIMLREGAKILVGSEEFHGLTLGQDDWFGPVVEIHPTNHFVLYINGEIKSKHSLGNRPQEKETYISDCIYIAEDFAKKLVQNGVDKYEIMNGKKVEENSCYSLLGEIRTYSIVPVDPFPGGWIKIFENFLSEKIELYSLRKLKGQKI